MALTGKNCKMQCTMRLMVRVLAVTAFTATLFATAPATAQSPAELQCRAVCGAMPRDDRARLLACLSRCGVAVQGATAQPARGQPARGQATRQQTTPAARLIAGNGFGRPVASLGVPNAEAASLPVAPPRSSPGQSWGAIYAAPAPHPGLGIVTGQRDRLQAHGRAETACAARANGLPCRMLVEFTSGCAAAARAERGDRVAFTAAETGSTRAAAEHAAIGSCQNRSRDACRVVQTVCAG